MSTPLEIIRTEKFGEFLNGLKDVVGKANILARLKRLSHGNWGDAGPVGDGVVELRIDVGPGYRVYCKKVGATVVVILGGGSKNRQQADIDAAKAYANTL
jgi:putative addiction module killer protein